MAEPSDPVEDEGQEIEQRLVAAIKEDDEVCNILDWGATMSFCRLRKWICLMLASGSYLPLF